MEPSMKLALPSFLQSKPRWVVGSLTVLLLALVLGLLHCKSDASDALKNSVVKIFVVCKRADYNQPWLMTSQYSASGSGMILPGNRILTNAHVVSDQVFVQVLKAGDTKRYTARVEYVGHDLECALLSVEDPKFFEGTIPVEFGDVPQQRDKVAAYGFPVGGDEMSITEGVVSRIEVLSYVHSQRNLLAIQTDAAINPATAAAGVREGQVHRHLVPVFQGRRRGEHGIHRAGAHHPALPERHRGQTLRRASHVGDLVEKMENESLREKFSMKKDQSGILATSIVPGSAADGIVKAGDVLLAVNGVKVANDGTVPFGQERLEFSHLSNQPQWGKPSNWRSSATGFDALDPHLQAVEVLGARPQYDELPSYFVAGGLVFTPLTFNYMVSSGGGWNSTSSKFRYLYENGVRTPECEQVVVLSQVLPHEINVGYHDEQNMIVAKVNGQKIRNLADVVAAFEKPQGKFHVIEADAEADDSYQIVLSADGVQKANDELLTRFKIPSAISADLKSTKPAAAPASAAPVVTPVAP
jgi:S1-C subfamily serine protease